MIDFIDIEKPALKHGETLCNGCWVTTVDKSNWIWMNFKYLDPQWLCPKCQEEYKQKFAMLQMAGL